MTGILYSPMVANRFGKSLDSQRQATDEESQFRGFLPPTNARQNHQANRRQFLPIGKAGQRLWRRHLDVLPLLFAPVAGFFRYLSANRNVGKVVVHSFDHVVHHAVVQFLLVPLERQHEVPATIDDLLRNCFLSAHGVDRDDRALHVHQLQDLRNCRDFVRFLVGGHLCQRDSILTGPNGDGVERSQALLGVVAAPQRLSIDCQRGLIVLGDLRRIRTQCLDPIGKALLKYIGLRGAETSPKDILAGNAVWQRQQRFQKVSVEFGPGRDACRTARLRQHPHNGDHDHTLQSMLAIDLRPRIFQFLKVTQHLVHRKPRARHRMSSVNPESATPRSTLYRNYAPGANFSMLRSPSKSARWPWVHVLARESIWYGDGLGGHRAAPSQLRLTAANDAFPRWRFGLVLPA